MSPLEIISRLCDVTETLSAIVKKQQTIIEQSKIEEAVSLRAAGSEMNIGDKQSAKASFLTTVAHSLSFHRSALTRIA